MAIHQIPILNQINCMTFHHSKWDCNKNWSIFNHKTVKDTLSATKWILIQNCNRHTGGTNWPFICLDFMHYSWFWIQFDSANEWSGFLMWSDEVYHFRSLGFGLWICYGRWICTNIPGHTSSQIVLQSKVSGFFFLCQNLDIIDKIGSDNVWSGEYFYFNAPVCKGV